MPTWVQDAVSPAPSSSSATSIALAYSSANLTSGSVLCCVVTWGSTNCTPTCSDSVNGSWTAGPKSWNSGYGQGAAVFYKANNSATGKPTVTVSFAGNSVDYRGLIITEISGCDATQPDVAGVSNQQDSAPSSANGITSGLMATATDGDYIYGASVQVGGSSATLTAGTNFTARGAITSVVPILTEGYAQAAHGNIAATFTDTNGPYNSYITFGMAFKALSSGESAGSASGESAVSGVGASIAAAAGTASGSSSVGGVTSAIVAASGASSGSSTTSGVGIQTVAWMPWSPLIIGEYTKRGFKVRLRLRRSDLSTTPVVTAASLRLDMRDRIVPFNQTIPLGGARIDFDPPFYSAPQIGLAVENGAEGDRYTITNKTVDGFDINFTNGGSNVGPRTISGSAVGYGEQTL